MKVDYFINKTSGSGEEICFYDADKYDENNAFGNELFIDAYIPEYPIEETIKKLQNESNDEEIISEPIEDNFSLKVHCKPTYDYQSLEFDWEIKNLGEDFGYLKLIYKELVNMLMEVAPEQPDRKKAKPKKVEEPATSMQMKILKQFNIPHDPDISKKEAGELIRRSVDRNGRMRQ